MGAIGGGRQVQALLKLVNWHQGIVETLQSRQLWAAVATIVGLLLQNFLNIHVSETVLLGWILSGLAVITGSSVAQAGHAQALGQLLKTATPTAGTQVAEDQSVLPR
jgi:hypothetical protein